MSARLRALPSASPPRSRTRSRPGSTGSTRGRQETISTTPTRPGSTARAPRPAACCRASIRRSPTRSTATAWCRTRTFNANGAETATLYQQNITQAHNFQWHTEFNDGGPLRGNTDFSFSHATSNLQAAQADVEHGLYTTSAGVATSPAAPGCNNGASTCATGPGNHGYEFTYDNGGTSGLPCVSYLSPYADVLNNPAYTTFKSNWAWANLTDSSSSRSRRTCSGIRPSSPIVQITISGGVDYAGRDIDQIFGRYLINGTLPNGEIAGNANGPNPSNPGAAFGPLTTTRIRATARRTFPIRRRCRIRAWRLTVNNFGAGNIIVKNPSTGGMTNPSTYLQTGMGRRRRAQHDRTFLQGQPEFVRCATNAPTALFHGGHRRAADRFHANFGVRVVKTDLTINSGQTAESPTYYGTASWNGVDSNVVPRVTKRNYTDVLPSFNFVLDVTDVRRSASAPRGWYRRRTCSAGPGQLL